MIKFGAEFGSRNFKDKFTVLTISPQSITETPQSFYRKFFGGQKLYILQTINKNKGSDRLKHASVDLSKLFSNLNYKVK